MFDDNGFLYGLVYYGWINTSNLETLNLDLVVISGSDEIMVNQYDVVQKLISNGVEVYAYLHDGSKPVGLGSSFYEMVVNNTTGTLDERLLFWESYIKSLIDRYAGKVTGVFFDECDPGYFGITDPQDPYVQAFSTGIRDLVDYAHSKGLKVLINGVRGYSNYGDLYLWESFCSTWTGSPDNPNYTYVEDFFQQHAGDSNPLEWVNDYAKYLFLKENGSLNKTIGLSYGPLTDFERMRLCYYMARILGLRGIMYGPASNYAKGGKITSLFMYPLGDPLSDPVINDANGILSRVFVSGNVTINISSGQIVVEDLVYTIPDHIVVDGLLNEWSNKLINSSHKASNPNTDIIRFGIIADELGYYIALEFNNTYNEGIIGILLDTDNNTSTGYVFNSIGADVYVEAYATTNEVCGYKYTGNGTSWSWNTSSPLFVTKLGNNANQSFEIMIPVTKTSANIRLYIVTYNNYVVDDVEPYPQPLSYRWTLQSFSNYYLTNNYMPQGYQPNYFKALTSIGKLGNETVYNVTVYNSTGSYSKVALYLDFNATTVLMDNGSLITLPRVNNLTKLTGSNIGYYVEQVGGYYKYTIRVGPHSSPINIYLTIPQLQPIPEPRTTVYIVVCAIILIVIMLLYFK